jgi:hypothetical protein
MTLTEIGLIWHFHGSAGTDDEGHDILESLMQR